MLIHEKILSNAVKEVAGNETDVRFFWGDTLAEGIAFRAQLYLEYGEYYKRYNSAQNSDPNTLMACLFVNDTPVASAEIGTISEAVKKAMSENSQLVRAKELEIRRLVVKKRVRGRRGLLVASLMAVAAQKYLEGSAFTYLGFARQKNHALFPFNTEIITESFKPHVDSEMAYVLFRGNIGDDFRKVQAQATSLRGLEHVA